MLIELPSAYFNVNSPKNEDISNKLYCPNDYWCIMFPSFPSLSYFHAYYNKPLSSSFFLYLTIFVTISFIPMLSHGREMNRTRKKLIYRKKIDYKISTVLCFSFKVYLLVTSVYSLCSILASSCFHWQSSLCQPPTSSTLHDTGCTTLEE